VGIPRSSLVKSKSPVAAVPAPLAIPEAATSEGLEIAIEAADVVEESLPAARAPFASAPSTSDLLERAAALGAVRMTWESIVLPTDPVLDQKQRPHVAERRARFTRVVKGTLAACVGVCVLALGITAASAVGSDAHAATSGSVASAAKTVPAKAVVPVERLEGTRLGKSQRRSQQPAVAVASVASMPRTKRR